MCDRKCAACSFLMTFVNGEDFSGQCQSTLPVHATASFSSRILQFCPSYLHIVAAALIITLGKRPPLVVDLCVRHVSSQSGITNTIFCGSGPQIANCRNSLRFSLLIHVDGWRSIIAQTAAQFATELPPIHSLKHVAVCIQLCDDNEAPRTLQYATFCR